jgi:hypothetical protein
MPGLGLAAERWYTLHQLAGQFLKGRMKGARIVGKFKADYPNEVMECLVDFFGADFETKTVEELLCMGELRVENILDTLEPFSGGKAPCPVEFNPRAINARFALGFLLLSKYFKSFVRIVKRGSFNKEKGDFFYFLYTVRFYENLEQFNKTVSYYSEMSDYFKEVHFNDISKDIVENQAIMVIDYANPTDQILNEIREKIEQLKEETIKIYSDITFDIDNPKLPISFGDGIAKKDGKCKLTKTWYRALKCLLLKSQGKKSKDIALRVFNGDTKNDIDQSYASLQLAERLSEAAYKKEPLKWWHD